MDIKQSLNEALLREYVNNDIIYLKKYLEMDDDEKKRSSAYDFSYEFCDFYELSYDDGKYSCEEISNDPSGFVEQLETQDPELFDQFADWCFHRIEDHSFDSVPETDYPAWSFFGQPEIIKNQWLIHFTDDAKGIAENGFIYGLDDYTRLGLTTMIHGTEKDLGGYNFAYLLSDFNYGLKSGWDKYRYGDEFVVFRASGVRAWHYSDEEPQVIFFGDTAKNIIPVVGDYAENDICVLNKKMNCLLDVSDDKLGALLDWIPKNYEQYRKSFYGNH